MAEQYGNRLCGLSALDLLCYVYESEDDARKMVNLAKKVFSQYGDVPQNIVEENLYNNLLNSTATAYIKMGEADSARS